MIAIDSYNNEKKIDSLFTNHLFIHLFFHKNKENVS